MSLISGLAQSSVPATRAARFFTNGASSQEENTGRPRTFSASASQLLSTDTVPPRVTATKNSAASLAASGSCRHLARHSAAARTTPASARTRRRFRADGRLAHHGVTPTRVMR
eukprot:CAMPEP_0204446030 /NCGR_PEP_ID=MMETSP0470-20130426/94016_1 /ASSEMBLY_ACC=CAM_ASM_000385 /TAXON_ID=2969 /ORGANISM="Oxyrrhis marina" /LENGTH=112 /DNA_ID=CAMNT_0051445563 /DNA_START=97 /DNA_END=432 /DNA_ORIENTATION=+